MKKNLVYRILGILFFGAGAYFGISYYQLSPESTSVVSHFHAKVKLISGDVGMLALKGMNPTDKQEVAQEIINDAYQSDDYSWLQQLNPIQKRIFEQQVKYKLYHF